MKILVIDDDADVRLIASLTLRLMGGMEVTEASGGADGVRKALDDVPDVILLDMMMPSMDGTATLAALRAAVATAAVPVIFLTAKVVGAEIARLKGLGAVGVLTKPFDPRTLAADVRALLAPKI